MTVATPTDIDVPDDEPQTGRRANLVAVVIAAVVFSALSIYQSFASPGFLEADSCTHYLYARFALREPHYLVNVWGRPMVTALFALPAQLGGRFGVHLTSLACGLVCAAAAYAIAKGQRYRWPALAVIFTLGQPLVFLHSFSELTELPFAAVIALAFLAYQRRQFLIMTILVALSPLARPEGFAFLALAAVVLVLHRRWWWLIVLPLPLLVWDYAGWAVFGYPDYSDAAHLPHALRWLPWLRHVWPYAPESVYGRGSLLQYVFFLPAVVSPLVLPAVLVGIWQSLAAAPSNSAPCHPERTREGSRAKESPPAPEILREYAQNDDWPLSLFRNHSARCNLLIAVIPLLILIAHSLLHALGKMASSGEVRYMIVVAPFWGLLAARGWERVWLHFNWRWPLRFAGLAILLPVLVNHKPYVFGRVWGYRVLPMDYTADMLQAKSAAEWYRSWPLRAAYPHVLAAHPGIHYFLDISPTTKKETEQWTRPTIAAPPPGTVLIWDPMYGYYNSDANRSVTAGDVDAGGWVVDLRATRRVAELTDDEPPSAKTWSVWLSPRGADDQPTPVNGHVPRFAQRAWDDR